MPEGDTIYRAARTLDLALAGRTVTRFISVYPHLNRVDDDTPIAGRVIESVAAIGKHLLMTFSGGLVLGAVYMATDLVTSPVTNGGRWIFGAGIGALVVLIRVWGGLAEGVMYAILIMNALVPFINRATQPRVFGTRVTEPGS